MLDSGGVIALDRREATAVYMLPHPVGADALVHPYLVPAAAVAAHWRGDVCFHAGGFVLDGRAWGVLAPKDGGKTTLLAGLAGRGVPVLADDALVLRAADTALAGPRCLDLRKGAAERFAGATPLGMIGDRERWRLALAPAPAETPFAGWVALGWGDGPPRTEPVALAGRLRALTASLTLRTPPRHPQALLDAATPAMVRLTREADWSALEPGLDVLLDALRAAGRQPGGLQQGE
ncbi:hypothetical protein FSW04_03110 [Baekduia soli]|uniref:Serine kinase n=1 Tax=Baekduia soli TaxID=496014 RepID=A0A5B8U151_9ACTN|nr:hypothetical protein [Baekduia soli]QEC46670.1 hypothetical protein FSW04_03110 [Baekduia soli]